MWGLCSTSAGHPAEATSWNAEAARQILAREGVESVIADQCTYGFQSWVKNGKAMPARKRTKFMTKRHENQAELQIRCDGSHEHQRLLGGGGKPAQRYPKGLRKAMCAGLVNAFQNRPMKLKQFVNVDRLSSVQDENKKGDHTVQDKALGGGWAMDDLTVEELEPVLVRRARRQEMAYIHNNKVWTVRGTKERMEHKTNTMDRHQQKRCGKALLPTVW